MVLAIMRLPPAPTPAVIDSRLEPAVERMALPDLWWEMYRKIQNANRSTAET